MNAKNPLLKILNSKYFKIFLIFTVILLGSYLRLKHISEKGGDYETYRSAVSSFLKGENIYEDTVLSYIKDDSGSHGYAYFPTLLYLYAPLYKLSKNTDVGFNILYKIPIFIADLATGLLIFFILFKKDKDFYIGFLTFVFWFLNPHLIIKNTYVLNEPLGIFFMVLALKYLGESDIKSGIFYAISFSFKSFSIVLFPLFLLKSNKKLKFIISGALVALVISIPFLKTYQDFLYFLEGSLLVHGYRGAQGRPVLGYISYQIYKSRYYVLMIQPLKYISLIFGTIVSFFLYYKKKISGKYIMSAISMMLLLLISPVFNDSYLIWLMPLYSLGLYEHLLTYKNKLGNRTNVIYVLLLLIFWGLYGYYLKIWDTNFYFSEGGINF